MKPFGMHARKRTALAVSTALVATAGAGVASAAPAPAPQVMVSANFDNLPNGRISPQNFMKTLGGTNKSTTPYDDTSIVEVPGKGKVIRTTFVKGTMKSKPSGNNGSSLFLPLNKVVNQACMSYDIRFDGNFDWSLGGKLPGLEGVAPGVSPGYPTGGNSPGDKGWSARLMWLTPKSYGWAGPVNEVVSYMYNPKQKAKYGENVRWHKRFGANKWHTVKQCFTMNTVGKADGKLHAWFDGVQVLANNAYTFRKRTNVGISHILWHNFRGGNTSKWAGSRTSYVDMDNVLITSTTGGSGTPPASQGSTQASKKPAPSGPQLVASDDFGRTSSKVWGSADKGGAWTVAGTQANYRVRGGVGTMTVPSSGTTRTATLDRVSTRDQDLRVTVTPQKKATGGGTYVTLIGRKIGRESYRTTLVLKRDRSATLGISKVGRGETRISPRKPVSGFTFTAGDRLNMRFQVTGSSPTTLKTKVWKVGTTEPTGWTATATDRTAALQAAGGVGVATYVSSAATNAPTSFTVDALRLYNGVR